MKHILRIIGYLVCIFWIGGLIFTIITEISQLFTTSRHRQDVSYYEDEVMGFYNRLKLYDSLGLDGYIHQPFKEFSERLKDHSYSQTIYDVVKKEKYKMLFDISSYDQFCNSLFNELDLIFTEESDILYDAFSYSYMNVDRQKALFVYLLMYECDDMPLDFKQFYYSLTKRYNAEEVYSQLIYERGDEIKYTIGETLDEFINFICSPFTQEL